MSLLAAALTHKSEEEGVAESVSPSIDVTAPRQRGIVTEHNAISGSAVTLPPQRNHRSIHSTVVGASGNLPRVSTSPLDLYARQREPRHTSLLEAARMDREMARELRASSEPRGQKSAMSIMGALLNMSNQRFLILAAGVLLLTVGLLALRFPVFLSAFDQWGFEISCGTGLHSNFTQAGIADPTAVQFVDQCHTAIAMRRAWAFPLAAAGALLLSGLLVIPPRQQRAATQWSPYTQR